MKDWFGCDDLNHKIHQNGKEYLSVIFTPNSYPQNNYLSKIIRFCQHDHYIHYKDGSYSQQSIIGFCTDVQCQMKLVCQNCIEIFHSDHKEKIMRYKDLQLLILKNFSDDAYQLQKDRKYYNEQITKFQQYKEKIIQVIENFENEFTSVCNKVYQMIDFYILAEQVRNENWAEITEQSISNNIIKLLNQNQQKILSNYQSYNVQILRYRDRMSKIEQQIKCSLEEIDFSPFLQQWITLKELLMFYENNQLDYLDAPIDCANIKGLVISSISNDSEQYYGELNEKNQRNGKGMQIQVKGQIIYEGIWNQNQLIWGQKTQYIESGECIILRGKMHDKKISGEGMKISSFGDKYEGTFQNDIMQGKGTFFNRNGEMYVMLLQSYVGTFCEGKMNGKGSIKSEVNGKLIWKYEGFFKNGTKHGEGTYYEPNGDMYSFRVNFKEINVMERENYKCIMVINIKAILNLEKKMVKESLYETMEKRRSVYMFQIRNKDNLNCLEQIKHNPIKLQIFIMMKKSNEFIIQFKFEMEQYTNMLDRVMAQEIQSVNWSKTMDVCAILYVNNQLEICRVGEQLQRMFIIQEDNPISNIIVESTFLVYNVGSKFQIYHLASHQRIIQSNLIRGNDKIQQLLLVNVNVKAIKEEVIQASVIPIQTTNLKNWQNWCFLKTSQVNSIVFSLTNKVINYNFNGILHLGQIDQAGINQLHQYQHYLHCFSSKQVYIYDISQLQHSQILKYIQQLSYLNELLSFLKTSILFVNSQLQDIYKTYQLNIIGPLLSFGPAETINLHILQYYQQGTCAIELVQFFQKELYNTKILQKMDENVTHSFNNIQEIMQDSLMNVLQRILVILNYFIESKQMPFFQGLHQTPFEELQSTIKTIFKIFSRFQLECHETKLHLKNFFVWLNLCAIKASSEQEVECENINSPLNKIEVDLNKLYDFLKDIHLFSLKNLQCFYSEKIQPKKFFTKPPQQTNTQIKPTDNVTKILKNVFQSLYVDPQNDENNIQCEEPFVTVNSQVRQLQNYQDKIQINITPKLVNVIKLNLEDSLIRFSQQESYQLSVLGNNIITQYTFTGSNFEKINEITINNRMITELQYYQDKLIILSIEQQFGYLSSQDEDYQNKYECHTIRDLKVSERGLISVIVDQKKLIILSI